MYPAWSYYPRTARPPAFVNELVDVVVDVEPIVSTVNGAPAALRSDEVLQAIAPGLRQCGYVVESGKALAGRIRRPVLFGEYGQPAVSYEIDAFHDECGVVVEVEAARGARGNAVYRDLVRSALIVDARYLALLLPTAYRHLSGGRNVVVHAYAETRAQLDAIFASDRLKLPFEGVLLLGY